MNNTSAVRLALPFLAALALPGSLRSDASAPKAEPTTPAGRIVIRGSGSNVRLERETTPPAARRQFVASRSTVLDELARMGRSGVAAPVLMSYLRTHAKEVPKVVSQNDLDRLQQAGVGDAVVAYLTRTAAVDIGLSGEGSASPVYVAGAGTSGAETSVYADDMGGSGYPWAYGSGYGGYSPFRRHFLFFHHHQPFPVRPRPVPLGFGPPRTMGTRTMGAISRSPRRPGDGF